MSIKKWILRRFPSVSNALRLNVYHRRIFYAIPPECFESAAGIFRRITRDYGYGNSGALRSCVRADGEAIPWYTYPAIEFLEKLSFAGKTVFEYGAGQSTFFWSKRCHAVHSVEDNPDWYNKLVPTLPGNCSIRLVTADELGRYVMAVRKHDNVDVVIVDGLAEQNARTKCCIEAVKVLSPSGMIILDNSDRLPAACAFLQNAGFTQIDFAGFTPLNEWAGCTSIFFRGSFGFERLPQRLVAVGGRVDPWESVEIKVVPDLAWSARL